MIAIAALAVWPSAAAAAPRGCTAGASWNQARTDLAERVVDLVNEHRDALGLRQLVVSRKLTTAATWKARHMATYEYLHHDDLGRSAAQRMEACNVTGTGLWGENIAQGQRSARSVVQAWLRSPGHRRNIERSQFSAIGVGVAAADDGTLYWAQDFGAGARSR